MESQVFQLLPCSISYDGPANVSQYLVQSEEMKTTLRGRGLEGAKLILPEGYTTVILKGGDVSMKAESVIIWTHDQTPNVLNSNLMNAPDWIKLSASIHS